METIQTQLAQAPVNIGEQYGSPFGRTLGVGNLVSIFLANAMVLAGITLFLLFLGGGIAIISGAGKNDPQSVAKGQQAVSAAIIGFLIVFAAYWIIVIIERVTGVSILGNPVG